MAATGTSGALDHGFLSAVAADERHQAMLTFRVGGGQAAVALLLVLSGRPAQATPPGLPCTDFLARTNHRPPHVAFMGCRPLPDEQGRPMRATYRVEGRYAAEVEAFLVRTVGLARLRRSCCVWDGPPVWFTDGHGHGFMLTMASDEMAASSRDRWRLIPGFTITVDAFRERI